MNRQTTGRALFLCAYLLTLASERVPLLFCKTLLFKPITWFVSWLLSLLFNSSITENFSFYTVIVSNAGSNSTVEPRNQSEETFYSVCLVAQLCLTLYSTMDWSLPGSSVHGIFQARILEQVAISYSRGSSRSWDQTWVSHLLRWQVGSLPLHPLGSPFYTLWLDTHCRI